MLPMPLLGNLSRAVFVTAMLLALFTVPAVSDDDIEFQKALDASESGDYKTALKILPKLGRKGHAGAQLELGNMLSIYAELRQNKQDHAEAAEYFQKAASWWRLAAEQGVAVAQFNLGVLYANGEGVPQDYGEALSWYQLAGEQGHSDAQHNLGVLYDDGKGVQQDHAMAVSWWLKSAEQGNAESQYSLGNNYNVGEGVPQNLATAVSYYRKAAEQGQVNAQYNLGYCYDHGRGVSIDTEKAIFWYRKAAEQGHVNAKHNLKLALQKASKN